MSYTNGIGNPQQAPELVTARVTSPANSPVTSPVKTSGLHATPSAGAATNQASAPGSVVQDADQTSLSSAGGVVAQALGGSDVRSAKVAALQQTIAAGSYSVSASDIAEKIIQSLLDQPR